MENVNKIQIRLDQIKTTGVNINIPFGLEFLPVDNSELQQTEFVEKEIEKAINPIFDNEKYPFYPTFQGNAGITDSYTVEYLTDLTLADLNFTEDDIRFNRKPFKQTYLRLNFYDSPDIKVQKLIGRETVHLKLDDNWFFKGKLLPLLSIPVTFISNQQNIFYNSVNGEGFNYYWYKTTLPYTVYVKPSIMNAKTGNIINLFSSPGGALPGLNSKSVEVTFNGYNYIKCDFYKNLTKQQEYYYIFNSDNKSFIKYVEDLAIPSNNKITVNLFNY